jgi:ribokinase
MDYSFLVEGYPEPDDKINAESFSRQGGGPVATALCTLGKFGARSVFIGKCGDDNDGHDIKSELDNYGVNTDGLILDKSSISPKAFIIVDRQTGKRTVILNRNNTATLSPDELNIDLIQNSKFLLLDGRESETSVTAAKIARGSGVEVILDAGSPRKDIDKLLPYVDHLVASHRFSSDYINEIDPARAVLKLIHMGFKNVVITSGVDGCVGANSEGEIFRQGIFAVDVIDTTGAGDVFHGAYIYVLYKNWELPKILKFASATAALKCRALGGRAIPDLPEIKKLIGSD